MKKTPEKPKRYAKKKKPELKKGLTEVLEDYNSNNP